MSRDDKRGKAEKPPKGGGLPRGRAGKAPKGGADTSSGRGGRDRPAAGWGGKTGGNAGRSPGKAKPDKPPRPGKG